jgi:signal recognition particle receptor subunit alpha
MRQSLTVNHTQGTNGTLLEITIVRMSPVKGQEKKVEPKKASRRPKEDRVWGGGGGKISSKQAAALDRSERLVSDESKELREIEQNKAIYLPSEGERPLWEIEQEESSQIEEALKSDPEVLTTGIWKSLQSSYLGSMIQTITGGKILEESDLKPVLDEMKEMLQSKNVAQEIADDICSSVGRALIGHRLASFTGIKKVVLEAIHAAVQRILTPGTSIDVLRQVLDAKASGKIFSIVFVGINGNELHRHCLRHDLLRGREVHIPREDCLLFGPTRDQSASRSL